MRNVDQEMVSGKDREKFSTMLKKKDLIKLKLSDFKKMRVQIFLRFY